ncbi:hypothetical protein HPB50_007910 [Hyalomma asiaticum]|uniref:Uncharacterized protein n=1 Tax=Hyalomma asiaticum TaxID=266040 RepID=A0ACB7SYK5_HYAAI|nr:hypothetical protein HPB50_007910 [Hyalomma asiaticum]
MDVFGAGSVSQCVHVCSESVQANKTSAAARKKPCGSEAAVKPVVHTMCSEMESAGTCSSPSHLRCHRTTRSSLCVFTASLLRLRICSSQEQKLISEVLDQQQQSHAVPSRRARTHGCKRPRLAGCGSRAWTEGRGLYCHGFERLWDNVICVPSDTACGSYSLCGGQFSRNFCVISGSEFHSQEVRIMT